MASSLQRCWHRCRVAGFVLVVVAAASGSCGTPARAPAPASGDPGAAVAAELASRIDRLDAAIRAEMPAAGATIAVSRGGQIVAVHAVGLADLEQRVPATADTVYCIGSISKAFAAAAVLQLVEQGRLALDDELGRYLPDFPTGDGPITIHHLLHHESGIPDFEYVGTWPTTKAVRRTKPQVVDTFRDLPREFEPGTRWRYSTSNYYLLGLVIEAVTGAPVEDHLRERVFVPAGLTATTFCGADALIPHRARGYTSSPDGAELVNAELADLAQFGLGGGICSTAADLLRFWEALRDGSLVSPGSLALMRGPHPLADGTPTFYGYGLFTTRFRGQDIVGHAGGVPGFSAQLLHYPGSELAIASLGNTDGLHPLELEQRLAVELIGLDAIHDRPVPEAVRDRVVGCYAFDGLPGQAAIIADAERLQLRDRRGKIGPLRHLGDGVFLVSDERQQLSFEGGGERATRMVNSQYGMAFVAERVACGGAPGP